MVSTQRDHTGQRLATLGGADLGSIRCWRPREDAVVALFNLVQSICVIVSARLVRGTRSTREPRSWPNGDSYEVTGISPQSSTVAQLLNGFVSNGTLYPPLEPCETVMSAWRKNARKYKTY